jgi:uncharacterized protein
MKNLLIKIVQALVDYPEQVSINEIEGDQIVALEFRAAKSDMGKIIGKKGRNVNAIRTILNAASGGSGKRYVLELVE